MNTGKYIIGLAALSCLGATLYSPKQLEQAKSWGLPRAVIVRPTLTLVSSNAMRHVYVVWQYSTTNLDFKVYYGPSSGTYTNVVNVHSKTNTLIQVPQGAKLYYVVTAVSNLLESDYSNQVTNILPVSFDTVTVSWNPTTATNLQISSDLKTWSTVVTNSPYTKLRDKKQEFFRLKL